jgi:anti-sigma factor (TIGR02949 family)
MSEPKLSCRELIDFLDRYLDGELSADERTRFDAHLAACPYCVDYIASYRETIRLGKRACEPDAELPDEVPARLVEAILASRRRR